MADFYEWAMEYDVVLPEGLKAALGKYVKVKNWGKENARLQEEVETLQARVEELQTAGFSQAKNLSTRERNMALRLKRSLN